MEEIKMNLKDVLPALEKRMNSLKIQLEATPRIKGAGYSISSGAWINKNGVGIGYISCLQHPGEDTIDLTIDFVYKENILRGSAGIYWSNGRLVKNIADVELVGDEINKLLPTVELFIENVGQEALGVLADFLIEQKDESN
jgi:hypothetical protein